VGDVGRRWAYAGTEYTVGVEEELMLLDRSTLDLSPAADPVVDGAADRVHVKQEIRQCMVEIASRPWTTSTQLRDDLAGLRRSVARAAEAEGCLVAGGGTHPFSEPETQVTTATPRYLSIMDEVGFPWRRALVFGTHVHVAVADADKAIQVTEALLPDLPVLVAVGSTSPFWRGRDTGLASTRLAVMADVPRTGLPPAFDSFRDYRSALAVLRRAGAVPDASQVWWDVRSQARLGTIEVRILDSQVTCEDSAALAGVVQSLVRHHGQQWDAGRRCRADRFMVGENRWLALRHGMDARLVAAHGEAAPAACMVDELLDRVSADAAAVGAGWALDHVARLARDGGGATALRQLRAEVGSYPALLRRMVDISSGQLPT
jgi:glutamate---cysteine ligase / carboxylate-amine ligase